MRIGGLASGMDTNQIVKDLMNAQKIPMEKLMQKKVWSEWQQESLRDFNLSLSSLRTSASNLRLQSTFNSYSATSSDPSRLSVSTTANAVSGSYRVEVMSVASPAKLNSENTIIKFDGTGAAKSTDLVGTSGKIMVNSGTDNIVVEITASMTYAEVAKKLQDSTAGSVPELRANFDNTTSRFFISTKGMGSDQAFSLAFKNADGTTDNTALANQIINNASGTATATATGAENGEVSFDGVIIDGLKTNQTTVNGLTLNLLKVGPETTVNVQSNPEKPMTMIKEFVEKYNETIADIEKQLIQKRYPTFQPLSDEQKKDMSEKEIELWEEKARSGLLRNDPTLKNAIQDLRRAFMDPVAVIAGGNFNMMSQIGINTGSYTEGGKLFIDEAKLSAALTNKPDEVMQLFTFKDAAGSGIGIGDRVYQKLNDVIKNLSSQAGSPGNSVDNSTISKRIKQMDQEISRWQDRLTMIEDRYWKQFSAMEKALSQMNSQSSWMQQSMFGGTQ